VLVLPEVVVEAAPPVPPVVALEELPPFPPVVDVEEESTLPPQAARDEKARALLRMKERVRMGGAPFFRNRDATAVRLWILCGSDEFD